jgi:putative transposase
MPQQGETEPFGLEGHRRERRERYMDETEDAMGAEEVVTRRPEKVCILLDPLVFKRRSSGLRVCAWVVLENHRHMALQSPVLSKTLEELRSYTARQILAYLQAQGVTGYLERVAYLRKAHKKGNRSYQSWHGSLHPEPILSR